MVEPTGPPAYTKWVCVVFFLNPRSHLLLLLPLRGVRFGGLSIASVFADDAVLLASSGSANPAFIKRCTLS